MMSSNDSNIIVLTKEIKQGALVKLLTGNPPPLPSPNKLGDIVYH